MCSYCRLCVVAVSLRVYVDWKPLDFFIVILSTHIIIMQELGTITEASYFEGVAFLTDFIDCLMPESQSCI